MGKLEALEAGLSVGLLEKIARGLHETKLPVTLPRFSMMDGYALGETLRAMGMKDAFVPGRADFGGMSAGSLFLQAVVHKTFIQVNEEGTEAAAASAVAAGKMSMPTEVPPEFHADHPFLFIVWDRGTGVILFIGRVKVPEMAGS